LSSQRRLYRTSQYTRLPAQWAARFPPCGLRRGGATSGGGNLVRGPEWNSFVLNRDGVAARHEVEVGIRCSWVQLGLLSDVRIAGVGSDGCWVRWHAGRVLWTDVLDPVAASRKEWWCVHSCHKTKLFVVAVCCNGWACGARCVLALGEPEYP
jgi:hypothetical protein